MYSDDGWKSRGQQQKICHGLLTILVGHLKIFRSTVHISEDQPLGDILLREYDQ